MIAYISYNTTKGGKPKMMSLRTKVVFVVFGLAVAGIVLSSHILKHVATTVASAVWGS
jgi:hypothetical protein